MNNKEDRDYILKNSEGRSKAIVRDLQASYPCPYCAESERLALEAVRDLRELEASAPKWTRVEDGLPEDRKLCLVLSSFEGEYPNHFDITFAKDGSWLPWHFHKLRPVTHWMPLPTAPKEGE